jgi:aarF domain-containing kinase
MSKIKTSLWSRTPKLIKLAATAVVSEVKEKVMNLEGAKLIQERVMLAKKMADQLGDLKGAAMKVGQLLSIDAGDFLPPEALEVLQKLHKSAEPIDFESMDVQLKKELQEKRAFLRVEPKAFAVASIGQVHTAIYKDQEIILKIQYPDVEKTIPTDVKMLKFVMNQWSFLMQKSVDLDPFFKELENTLMQETDYALEAQYLERASVLFKSDPRYLVPKVYREISTQRVLAMEKMRGETIAEWLKSSPSKSEREEIGRNLFDLFMLEFFNFGFVQTDPNPGNFLITSDRKIVLLDFGATKDYDQEFRKHYIGVLRAAYKDNYQEVLDRSFDFNLINPKESIETLDLYVAMMTSLIKPFREDRPFAFADHEFYKESKRYAFDVTKSCRHSPPPEKLIFLHRKLGGVFQFLKQLNVEINLHDYWLEYFDQKNN